MAPLMYTTRALFGSLSRGQNVKGQYRDLESLARAILGLGYTPEELIADEPEVLRDVFFAEGQQMLGSRDEELIDAVEGAFMTATMGRVDYEKIKTMVQHRRHFG